MLLAGCGGPAPTPTPTGPTATPTPQVARTEAAATVDVATANALATQVAGGVQTATARFHATAQAVGSGGQAHYRFPTARPGPKMHPGRLVIPTPTAVRRTRIPATVSARPRPVPPPTRHRRRPTPRPRPTATPRPTFRAVARDIAATLRTDVPADLSTAIGAVTPDQLKVDPKLAVARTYVDTAVSKLNLAQATLLRANAPPQWGTAVTGLSTSISDYLKVAARIERASGYLRAGNQRYLEALKRARGGIHRAQRDLSRAQSAFPR